jgi:hypothetical protein
VPLHLTARPATSSCFRAARFDLHSARHDGYRVRAVPVSFYSEKFVLRCRLLCSQPNSLSDPLTALRQFQRFHAPGIGVPLYSVIDESMEVRFKNREILFSWVVRVCQPSVRQFALARLKLLDEFPGLFAALVVKGAPPIKLSLEVRHSENTYFSEVIQDLFGGIARRLPLLQTR